MSRAAPDRDGSAPSRSRGVLREVRGYVEALVVAYLVITFGFNTVGVVGSSMEPNLEGGSSSGTLVAAMFSGDRVFIPKYETWLRRAGLMSGYQRGDIVVVREPPNAPSAQQRTRRQFLIKRVIGVPGDRLRIEGGVVSINGRAVDDAFITASGWITPDRQDFPVVVATAGRVDGIVMRFAALPSGFPIPMLPTSGTYPPPVPLDDPRVRSAYGDLFDGLPPLPPSTPDGVPVLHEFVVPEGTYFLMGDNRDRTRQGSEDSRVFGPVSAITIAGRASAVIWPPQRDGTWNWRALRRPAAFEHIE